MNIYIKSPEEITTMAHGGKILSEVLWEVLSAAQPGVTELELDALAERLIRQKGGEPGFQKVPGYKHTICACVNEVVVHGIPTKRKLQEGDLLCIDCGVYYKGYHTDMAETVRIKNQELRSKNTRDEIDTFLETGKRALEEAIKVAKPGNRIGHISQVIQEIVERKGGYGVVRTLIGHGVGKLLHEPPEVPGFLNRKIEKTLELVPGMTIAIEVIYNMGKKEVVYANRDGWTIKSKDDSLSAVFEASVAITENGPKVLTP